MEVRRGLFCDFLTESILTELGDTDSSGEESGTTRMLREGEGCGRGVVCGPGSVQQRRLVETSDKSHNQNQSATVRVASVVDEPDAGSGAV